MIRLSLALGSGRSHRLRFGIGALVAFLTVLLSGCSIRLKEAKGDLDNVIDELPDVDLDDLDVKVCGDQTLRDLLSADGLSEECRDKVESFLPEGQSNFESRIAVLGDFRDGAGARTIYVVGADAEGHAIYPSAASDVVVSVSIEGEARVLVDGEFTLEFPQLGDLLSVSVVNDYSASMRDADLDVVSDIEHDLFEYLPPVYEGEVFQFSTTVQLKQPFTTDAAALSSAVARDREYERASTALYDGMGAALTNLTARTRPVRLLLVSTDGAENASMMYTEPQLLTAIDQSDVFVIMLGALFADVSTLRRLAGDRGIYVYARGYGRLKTAVQGLLQSFAHVTAIHLPAEFSEGSVTVSFSGQEVTLE